MLRRKQDRSLRMPDARAAPGSTPDPVRPCPTLRAADHARSVRIEAENCASVYSHGFLHVVALLFDELLGLGLVDETILVGELILQELLVFRCLRDLGKSVGKQLYTLGRRAGAHDDRAEQRQPYLEVELVGARDIFEVR